jgi:glycosyltransferase involved in cell wall biosynthesis
MQDFPETSGAKILLVWDRIGDYHAARFRALENFAGTGNVLMADLGGADKLYKWKNPLQGSEWYKSLSSKPVEEPDAKKRLEAFKELVKIHQVNLVGIAGYGRPEYRAMLHWCRMKGVKVVLFAESWYTGNLDFLKGLYLRFLCRGFLVSGLRAKNHFVERLGLPENRVYMPYSVVDNRHFSAQLPDYSSKKILCLARFSEEKNLVKLIAAFGASRIAANGWKLELVGGGPLKQLLLDHATEGIVFRDWVAYEDLPALYTSASFFILPSIFEPWGLVVNEAMAAGLPVALSEECGCAPDLVPDPAFRFPAKDDSAIAALLQKLPLIPEEELRNIGLKNRERINAFSPEAWAEAFLQASAF